MSSSVSKKNSSILPEIGATEALEIQFQELCLAYQNHKLSKKEVQCKAKELLDKTLSLPGPSSGLTPKQQKLRENISSFHSILVASSDIQAYFEDVKAGEIPIPCAVPFVPFHEQLQSCENLLSTLDPRDSLYQELLSTKNEIQAAQTFLQVQSEIEETISDLREQKLLLKQGQSLFSWDVCKNMLGLLDREKISSQDMESKNLLTFFARYQQISREEVQQAVDKFLRYFLRNLSINIAEWDFALSQKKISSHQDILFELRLLPYLSQISSFLGDPRISCPPALLQEAREKIFAFSQKFTSWKQPAAIISLPPLSEEEFLQNTNAVPLSPEKKEFFRKLQRKQAPSVFDLSERGKKIWSIALYGMQIFGQVLPVGLNYFTKAPSKETPTPTSAESITRVDTREAILPSTTTMNMSLVSGESTLHEVFERCPYSDILQHCADMQDRRGFAHLLAQIPSEQERTSILESTFTRITSTPQTLLEGASFVFYLIEKGAPIPKNFSATLVEALSLNSNLFALVDLLERRGDIFLEEEKEKMLRLSMQNQHAYFFKNISSTKFLLDEDFFEELFPYFSDDEIRKTLQILLDTRSDFSVNMFADGYKDTLLHRAFRDNRVTTAFFLILHGASLDSLNINNHTPVDLLKRASYSEEIFWKQLSVLQNATAEERELFFQLDTRLLGHVVGDHLLKELKSLEGNTPSSSLSFLESLLSYVLLRYSSEISPATAQTIITFSQKIEKASRLALEIEEVHHRPLETKPISLELLGLKLYEQVQNLPIESSFYIPWNGFFQEGGHALFLEVVRRENGVELILDNTGLGSTFHENEVHDAITFIRTTRHYFIPKDHLSASLFSALCEFDIVGLETQIRYHIEEMYKFLEPYQIETCTPEDFFAWKAPQMSGTCSMRAPLAALAHRLGAEAEKVEMLLYLATIHAASQKVFFQGPVFRKILNLSLPPLFHMLEEGIVRCQKSPHCNSIVEYKAHMDTLTAESHSIQKAMPPKISQNSPFPTSIILDTMTEALRLQMEKLPTPSVPVIEQPKLVETPSIPLFEPSLLSSPRELIQSLTFAKEYFSKNTQESRHIFLQELMVSLSQFFLEEKSYPSFFKKLWQDRASCEKVLELIRELSLSLQRVDFVSLSEIDTYSPFFKDLSSMYGFVLARASSLAIGWKLGTHLDSRLQDFRPKAFQQFQEFLEIELGGFPRMFFQKREETHALKLLTFLKELRGEIVFTLDYQLVKGGCDPYMDSKLPEEVLQKLYLHEISLPKKGGDFHYIEPYYRAKGDWDLVDAKFQESSGNLFHSFENSRKNELKEYFRKTWFYFQEEYSTTFSQLRELSYATSASLAEFISDNKKRPLHLGTTTKVQIYFGLKDAKDAKAKTDIRPLLEFEGNEKEGIVHCFELENGFQGIFTPRQKGLIALPFLFEAPPYSFVPSEPSHEKFQRDCLHQKYDPNTKTTFESDTTVGCDLEEWGDFHVGRKSKNFDIRSIDHRLPFSLQDENFLLLHFDPKYHSFFTLFVNANLHDHERTTHSNTYFQILIEYYRKNPQDFMDAYRRNAFRSFLFRPFALTQELQKSLTLREEISTFLHQMTSYFQQKAKTGAEASILESVIPFLYEMQVRYISWCREFDEDRYQQQIQPLRRVLQELLQDPKIQKSLTALHSLFLTYSTSFSSERQLSEEDVFSWIETGASFRFSMKQHELAVLSEYDRSLPEAMYREAEALFYRHKETIERALKKDPQKTSIPLNGILEKYSLQKESLDWMESAFPVFQATNRDGDVFSIDLSLFSVQKNGKTYGGIIPKNLKDNYDVSSRILEKQLPFLLQKNYIEATDALGDIRIFFQLLEGSSQMQTIQMQRKYQGVWYTHIQKELFQSLPLVLQNSGIEIWQSQNPNNPLLCINTKDSKVLYKISQEGLFWLASLPDSEFHWVKPEVFSSPFGETLIWQEAHTTNPQTLLLFPKEHDEEGNIITFERNILDGKVRWVLKNHARFFAAENQKIEGLLDFASFLLLENEQGNQEALFPTTFDKITTFFRVALKGSNWVTSSFLKNMELAYLYLAYATDVKDYQKALYYLQRSEKFALYLADEVKLLKRISLSFRWDHSPEGVAICLLAAWMSSDNAKRNGGSVSWDREELQKLDILKAEYKSKAHLIPHALLLEEMIDRQQFFDWMDKQQYFGWRGELYSFWEAEEKSVKVNPTELGYPLFSTVRVSYNPEEYFQTRLFIDDEKHNHLPAIAPYLLRLSKSKDPKDFLFIQRLISWNQILAEDRNIKILARSIHNHFLFNPSTSLQESRMIVSIDDDLPRAAKVVPTTHPIQTPIAFLPSGAFNQELRLLYLQYFVQKPQKIDTQEAFPFAIIQGPSQKKSQEILQREWQKGVERNKQKIQHLLKNRSDLASLKTHLKQIVAQASLEDKKEDILRIANQLPLSEEETLVEVARRGALEKDLLTIDDCIHLFLRNSVEEYQKHVFLSKERIQTLHQLIGDYLIDSSKIALYKRSLAFIQKLEDFSLPLEERTLYEQFLGEELFKQREIDFSSDSPAFLVFEHYLEILLKKDQVEGLRSMIAGSGFQNTLIQRLQGGGKTLVFGHIMAYLKADGYHLSIQVPPTSLYTSSLYAMKDKSLTIFKQKERTFVFDDRPQFSTSNFLEKIYETLVEAIVAREYITVTRETLEALEAKCIKIRAQGEPSSIGSISLILENILELLQSRGVFTLDETHIALRPDTLLDMPYGSPSHPDPIEVRLIHIILRLAIMARDHVNNPYFSLKKHQILSENSTLQNDLIVSVTDQLLEEDFWKKTIVLEKRWQPALRTFLLEKTNQLPPFFDTLSKNEQTLLLLARELTGGGWLVDRLQRHLNERFGKPHDSSMVPIAIPYSGNMNPIEGSEFSDTHVMLINTLLAYFAEGLNDDQVKDLIKILQKEAEEEADSKSNEEDIFAVEDTTVYQEFTNTFQTSLSRPDIEQVQRVLQQESVEVYTYIEKYLLKAVFSKVDLYPQEISIHGQNLAAMALVNMGYSGSFDNPHIAPIHSQVLLEEGTNGQTMDLLLQRPDLWLVPAEAEAFLEILFHNHPKSEKIRALIDVGCHFLGDRKSTRLNSSHRL